MRKLLIGATLALSCTTMAQNPFSKPFDTPRGTPPFSVITNSTYEPAIDEAIKRANQEIDAICKQRSMPDFDNTIAALDRVGDELDRVLGIFFNLLEADSNEEMMEISLRVMPKISEYTTSVSLNERLWERIKQVWENREVMNLSPEETMLLTKTYDSFVRSGANLTGTDREKYKELSARLSDLTTRFGQNVLKELNTYKIYLTEEEMDGLPSDLIAQAASDAREARHDGEYLFTLAQPTYTAILKNANRRDVRERFYRLYTARNTKGEYSNIEIMKEIADCRLQLANLLGYKTYAQYSLAKTMAQTPENVYGLLDRLRDAYRDALNKEMSELADYAAEITGEKFTLMPWDYTYFSNKLRNARYAYDEEELRPYFPLDSVVKGVFGLATKLYGVTFVKNDSIEVYHPDVTAYDVVDVDGSDLGVLYTDFFPRESKRPGAWMTNFSEQYIDDEGINHRPQVSIVMNFTKPTADKPALLTPYEVETFLHEFGHSLHGLFANTKFKSMSGTNVYRDFVELPSQFNENYLTQKEFLDSFARHYETGETIPTELVDRLIASSQFGAAYACYRQLGFGYLDMAWHDTTEPIADPLTLETKAMAEVNMFPAVEGAMTSPQFSHIFSGGYAAGYYSYKWSELLDADAFAHFKQNGIFDRETAKSFRDNVLSRGGTEHPSDLYRRFRGDDPSIDALLERDGIKKTAEADIEIRRD